MPELSIQKLSILLALLFVPALAGIETDNGQRFPEPAYAEWADTRTFGEESDSAFYEALADGYFALLAEPDNNAQDIVLFARKAMAARMGITPEPAHLDEWVLSAAQKSVLATARAVLIDHLDRHTDSHARALALTSFDCWVARSEQAVDPASVVRCRGQFLQAIGVDDKQIRQVALVSQQPEEVVQLSMLQH